MTQKNVSKYTDEERFAFAESIEKKLKSFALRSIDVYKSLPSNDFVAQHTGKQLVRSSTSSAVNYRSERRAKSQNEFYSKISIVIKALDESICWLEMFNDLHYSTIEKLSKLVADGNEILVILAKSRKKYKQ